MEGEDKLVNMLYFSVSAWGRPDEWRIATMFAGCVSALGSAIQWKPRGTRKAFKRRNTLATSLCSAEVDKALRKILSLVGASPEARFECVSLCYGSVCSVLQPRHVDSQVMLPPNLDY